MKFTLAAMLTASLAALAACEEKKAPAPTPAPSAPAAPAPAAAPSKDSHAAHNPDAPVIELGVATIGPFNVRASRDEGKIVAGKDAPIDVWVEVPASSADKKVNVRAVRFWVGTQDAKGSAKAKAEIENPKEPNHWHTHAEIPSPIPTGSKLWVEIEDDNGAKHTASYDLKA